MTTAQLVVPRRKQAFAGNPFPGLRPFRQDEEHLFFGREGQVDTMVDKLGRRRFLAVLGGSGSGKSSLVNCGLRPALHRGYMSSAGSAWRIAQFRPGRHPISAMAAALAEQGLLFPTQRPGRLPIAQIVEDTLRMSKLGLVDVYRQARLGDEVNLLLIADQFEELFRFRQSAPGSAAPEREAVEEAVAFVNLLLEPKSGPTVPIYVVLTMRSDFLGDCAQFPGLAEAINEGQYLVPRLTREERRAAIEGPVGVSGASISPVLLTRLVNDVGDNPDQLSILQHALNRTWARWANQGGREGPISLEHYEAIGCMQGALDQHAEKAFAELETERKQFLCARLFKTLTDMGTDARGIRRPTRFDTLCEIAGATPGEMAEVIDVFRKPSRSFLMPPQPEPLEAATTVDISHESLMRVWKRLNGWAREEAESAQLYRRLADASERHALGKAALWTDPELQFALDWRAKDGPNAAWGSLYGAGFQRATAFLDASEAERARRIEQERAAQQRELEQAQRLAEAQARSARYLRVGLIAAVLIAIGGLALAAWAFKQQSAAEQAQTAAINAQGRAIVAQNDAIDKADKADKANQRAQVEKDIAETARTNAVGAQAKALVTSLSWAADGATEEIEPLWQIVRASDETAAALLHELFTTSVGRRKLLARGLAFRRALVGFNSKRIQMVRDAVEKHCTPAALENLEIQGACVALARSFYPADATLILRFETASQRYSAAWDNPAEYPALERDRQPYRGSVQDSLSQLWRSLDSKGASAVWSVWSKDLEAHDRDAMDVVVSNLPPADASAAAATLIRLAERTSDRYWFSLLGSAFSRLDARAKARVVDQMLEVAKRNQKPVSAAWLQEARVRLNALDSEAKNRTAREAFDSCAASSEPAVWDNFLVDGVGRDLSEVEINGFLNEAITGVEKQARTRSRNTILYCLTAVLENSSARMYPSTAARVSRTLLAARPFIADDQEGARWSRALFALNSRLTPADAAALIEEIASGAPPTSESARRLWMASVSRIARGNNRPGVDRAAEIRIARTLLSVRAGIQRDELSQYLIDLRAVAVRLSNADAARILQELAAASPRPGTDLDLRKQWLGCVAVFANRLAEALPGGHREKANQIDAAERRLALASSFKSAAKTDRDDLVPSITGEDLARQVRAVVGDARVSDPSKTILNTLALELETTRGSLGDDRLLRAGGTLSRINERDAVAGPLAAITAQFPAMVERDTRTAAAAALEIADAARSLPDAAAAPPAKQSGPTRRADQAPAPTTEALVAAFEKQRAYAFAVLIDALEKPPNKDRSDMKQWKERVRALAGEKSGPVDRTLVRTAQFVRTSLRTLIQLGAFDAFAKAFETAPASSEARAAALSELLHSPEPERSKVLCGSAPTLLEAWRGSIGKTSPGPVDRLFVEQIMRWPTCNPNTLFAMVRALADINGVPAHELGDRGQVVVMEQFGYWARKNGYHTDADLIFVER